MRRLIVVLLVLPLAATMWAGQASAPPPRPDEAPLPVSTKRVHEGLQRPALTIPPFDARVDFRMKVETRGLPVETVLEVLRRELAAQPRFIDYPSQGTIAQTLVTSPNLIEVVGSIVKGIKDARRARAERAIRQTVEQELAAFCAEHDCSVLEPGPEPQEGVIFPGGDASR